MTPAWCAGVVLMNCLAQAGQAQAGLTAASDEAQGVPHHIDARVRSALRLGEVSLIPNVGQWPESVSLAARVHGGGLWLRNDGLTFARLAHPPGRPGLERDVVSCDFADAANPATIQLGAGAGTMYGFIAGTDASGWHRGVPGIASGRYSGIWPGVDLTFECAGSAVKSQIVLTSPDATRRIAFRVRGVLCGIDANGWLSLESSTGMRRCPPPRLVESGAGSVGKLPRCKFRLVSTDTFGLVVPPEAAGTTVLDVSLLWSTFLGGASVESVVGMDLVGDDLVVLGRTSSLDFPTTVGGFDQSLGGFADFYLTVIDAVTHDIKSSTFIGGSGSDTPHSLATAPGGTVAVGGETDSPDFPVTGLAYQPNKAGFRDAFVMRFDPATQQVLYSTYFGGTDLGAILPESIHVSGSGQITIAGSASVRDLPTTPGVFEPADPDGVEQVYDGFVTRFTADGHGLDFSTYVGGSGGEFLRDMVVLADGDVLVVGDTHADSDFPSTPGVFDPIIDQDVFVSRLASDGSQLVFSTGLGGTGFLGETGHALALAADGDICVAGVTWSKDFPTTSGAADTVLNQGIDNGAADVFMTRMRPDGTALVYSTYFGSGADEFGDVDMAVDSSDAMVVFGSESTAPSFPYLSGALQDQSGGPPDAYIARLHPKGNAITYASLLGGSGNESADASLVVSPTGPVWLAVVTTSADFPLTPDALDQQVSAGDAALTQLDLLLHGVVRVGASTYGDGGPIVSSAYGMPSLGATDFTVVCENAPVLRPGMLAISDAVLSTPSKMKGADLWINPILIGLLPVLSDGLGYTQLRARIPDDPALLGVDFGIQWLWPMPLSPLLSSDALQITIQP